ncbi:MAG: hypothetical protein AAGH79_14055 [Bacteroidota bacterium]
MDSVPFGYNRIKRKGMIPKNKKSTYSSFRFSTWLIGLTVLFFLAGTPHELLGQTLHLIQVSGTSPEVRQTVRNNTTHWRAWAGVGGYTFQESRIDLQQVSTPAQLYRRLSETTIENDDIVVCYYAGEASYQEQNLLDNFPYFKINNQLVSQNGLHQQVLDLPGRLHITIYDVHGEQTGAFAGWDNEFTLDPLRIQQLLNVRGEIKISNYTRFETAYYNPRNGSIFGACFAQALKTVSSSSSEDTPLWSAVLDQTDTYMATVLKQVRKSQTAYSETNLNNEPSGWATAPKMSSTEGVVFSYAIPDFPFPPPPASASQSLDKTLFRQAEDMGGVDQMLKKAISSCGYYEKSYYSLPEGFALVTRIEQIQEDGSPMNGDARWSTNIVGMEEFSLQAYLKALFTERKGYFRVFVFMITNRPFGQTGTPVDQDQAKQWISEGLNKLPKGLAERPFSLDHNVSVLVYEFEQTETGKANYLKPGRHTSQTHLEKSRILEILVQNARN